MHCNNLYEKYDKKIQFCQCDQYYGHYHKPFSPSDDDSRKAFENEKTDLYLSRKLNLKSLTAFHHMISDFLRALLIQTVVFTIWVTAGPY